MVGLQTLDLAIGVRVPASQPSTLNESELVVTLHLNHESTSEYQPIEKYPVL